MLRPPSKRPRSRAAEASNEIASSHRCKRWGASFPQGLKEAGYVEGQNLAIEYRGGPPRIDRLRELATELVRRQVAAILTSNDGPAVAAKRETSTIPIVFFAIGSDPVTLGLVASINRPGGNVTGASMILRNGVGEPIPILVDQRFSGGFPLSEMTVDDFRRSFDGRSSANRDAALF